MASNAISTPPGVQDPNGSPGAEQGAATTPQEGKDLGVNQQPPVDETESLLMTFDPKGSKQAKTDAFGMPIYQLWKILDKWKVDSKFGSTVYEVRFWEDINDSNGIYHVDGKQLWDNYQQLVEQWEDTFGEYWQAKYANLDQLERKQEVKVLPYRVGVMHRGNQYTLLPPPLLPAFVRSARRPTTQHNNVGLSSGLSIIARSARHSTLGSPPLVGQSRIGSASRLSSHSTSSETSSLIGQLARVGFSHTQSTSSSLLDSMDIDRDERTAEVQPGDLRYNLYDSESDDEYNEKLDSFDIAAFDETMNAIAEQTEANLRPDEDITMVDVDNQDGEHARNPGMILGSFSKLLVEAHSEGLRELVEAALDLKGLPCDKWVAKRKEDATFEDMKLELHFIVISTFKRINEGLGKYESKPDGKRRYIKGPTQLKVISEWISIVRGRIAYERLRGRFREPLARPISKVGFASSLQRLEQHKKHVSSNYIMNLIEAIFLHDGDVYKNEQFVIFNCIEPCHGTFGEILCSRYAQAYSTHGGGFAHFAAGGGVNNANKHDEAHWSMAKEDLSKPDWFTPTIKKEVAKMRKEIEMISRLFTSAEEQDKQIEDMRMALEKLENLEEKLEISQNKLMAVSKEYCDLMDPMLELVRSV
ncbi:6b42fdd8-3bbb-4c21-a474-5858d024fd6f [Sclerotinia trifoliorum]|uniref:6b42fdd8-3bbb-4c21-a474-5858d024fd6f n=1 Tax=Sclerotinia trifoliorum TaxID=28548 RepID=A0A8H2VY17_9HELO|nr:6b42fdd8-3bbb-4c21-a474-5858d024fd6f [Sclerotinia trifoliorum]